MALIVNELRGAGGDSQGNRVNLHQGSALASHSLTVGASSAETPAFTAQTIAIEIMAAEAARFVIGVGADADSGGVVLEQVPAGWSGFRSVLPGERLSVKA